MPREAPQGTVAAAAAWAEGTSLAARTHSPPGRHWPAVASTRTLQHVKYIFEVRIKPGHSAEQYAACWLRVSALLQQAPGARGTQLLRRIGDSDVLLAIASWESKAARDAMDRQRRATVHELLAAAAEHCTIRVLGEFEEPEWVVNPPADPPAQ
jgi:heme-degrading monooxygenase HmoA